MSNIKYSKQRFSSTIEYYHRYRPDYPKAVVQTMIDECGLDTSKIIADIGMGTGIFTKNLLDNHNMVFVIEPNRDMRNIAISMLSGYSRFKAIDGSVEETHLPNHSVDFITCPQAFHLLLIRMHPRTKEQLSGNPLLDGGADFGTNEGSSLGISLLFLMPS